jgi:hypothetical protein
MKKENVKIGLIALLLCVVAILGTCEYCKKPLGEESVLQDTIFLNQWRKEKKEKAQLIVQYEERISVLESQRASLRNSLIQNKQILFSSREKAKFYTKKIANTLDNKVDSAAVAALPLLLDSLQESRQVEEQACDSTIMTLENTVANRDSVIVLQKQIEVNLREVQKEQELANQVLTNQLSLALKHQSKLMRRKRLITAGLIFLTGISSSLLINQSVK